MIKDNRQRLFEMMEKVAKMPTNLAEEYFSEQNLDEIDIEKDWSDMKYQCWDMNKLKDYLNYILENYNKPSHKREKPSIIVHNKVIKKTEEDEVDVQDFINQITAEPSSIITKGNTKMIKSSTDDFYSVTIGLPAFRGIVYDIENKRFIIIHTCPGAGRCVAPCYARKGNYVRLPSVYLKQTRILNLLLNDPEKFKNKLKAEILKIGNSKGFKEKEMRFRFNDSGDFFTQKYFQIGKEIMDELKADGFRIAPYAHTKIADIYNMNRIPNNFEGIKPDFIISFSVDANKKQREKVDLAGAKTSEIVDSSLFKDLFKRTDGVHYNIGENGKMIFINPDAENELKRRIANKFNVDINTLLMHDEMMDTPVANEKLYNVIVQAKGETDIPTQRPDVLRTFFLEH